MRIERLGDLAYILRDLELSPARTAHAIESARLAGVTDVVPCAETVGVYGLATVSLEAIEAACANVESAEYRPRQIEIPICYEMGEDLGAVAKGLGISPSRLVDRHSGGEYECFAVGFCPGFAYLGPIPAELRGVPRLASPRVRTEAGSLGITGNQTAVYPLPRPGGWPIIGKTPLVLVDEASGYFPISVGDRVRFAAIDAPRFNDLIGERL